MCARPVIKSMKTSSSEAAIGRTLTTRMPASRSAALDARRRRAGVAGATRTCARSPNVCTSMTPAARASTSSGGRRRVDDHLEHLPAEPRLQRGRRVEREQPPLVQQRDARAALRFVEVRRRHHDRQAARRNSDSSFQNSRRDTGSTPVVGSSSSSSRGSCTSVQASASFCFMPPDSRSARRVAERRQLRHLQQPIARRRVARDAVDLGEERDVLVDGEVAVEAEALRQVADVAR